MSSIVYGGDTERRSDMYKLRVCCKRQVRSKAHQWNPRWCLSDGSNKESFMLVACLR